MKFVLKKKKTKKKHKKKNKNKKKNIEQPAAYSNERLNVIVNKPSSKIHTKVILGMFNEKTMGSKVGTLNVIELPLFDFPEIQKFVKDKDVDCDVRHAIRLAWDSFIWACHDRQWNPKKIIMYYFPEETHMENYVTFMKKILQFDVKTCLFVSSLKKLKMFEDP